MSPHARGTRRRRAMPSKPAEASCRALILLDSEKIRRKILGDCSRARTTFHRAEAELAAYEAEDLPAFSRWYRMTFGPELEAIRETQAEAEALTQRIWRLEQYCLLAGGSFASAARLFEASPDTFARKEEELLEKARREEEVRMHQQEQNRQRFIREILPRFRKFLKRNRSAIQLMRREGWRAREIVEDLLETFGFDEGLYNEEMMVMVQEPRIQDLLRELNLMPDQETEPEYAREEEAGGGGNRGRGRKKPEPTRAGSTAEDARIKALKRELAFALHPDQDGGDDPQKLALWHQVQEAVAARDVDRLEVIQAHMHMLTGEVSGKTPVSRLQALTQMYRESRNALRRRIRKLRQSPEWGFRELDDARRNALRDRLHPGVLADRRRAESGLKNVQAEYRELKEEVPSHSWEDAPSLLDLFLEMEDFDYYED